MVPQHVTFYMYLHGLFPVHVHYVKSTTSKHETMPTLKRSSFVAFCDTCWCCPVEKKMS